MNWEDEYDLADFGTSPNLVRDWRWQDGFLFNHITLRWSEPIEWHDKRPEWPDEKHKSKKGLYAILRDHRHQKQRNEIQYIGIAGNLHHRLNCRSHPTAEDLVKKSGITRLSYALVVGSGNHTISKLKEIEDILIWAHWPTIYNKSCMNTLPSMRPSTGRARKRSRPWVISNEGYEFEGQMPREIVYPWMLIKRPRDNAVLKAGLD